MAWPNAVASRHRALLPFAAADSSGRQHGLPGRCETRRDKGAGQRDHRESHVLSCLAGDLVSEADDVVLVLRLTAGSRHHASGAAER